MSTLFSVSTVLLGPAATGAACPTAAPVPGGGRWRATWIMPSGDRVQTTAAYSGDGWSAPAAVRTGDEPANPAVGLPPAEGVLAQTFHGDALVALRTRRRVPGVRPQFPSAGLVISRLVAGNWQDVAFADDVPDGEVLAATVCVEGDYLLAVYLVADGRGGTTCRALRFTLGASPAPCGEWRRLPDYPLAPGVACPLAGMHGEVLIAAGGANFPDRPPWEGGSKKTYDEIFALPAGATAWQPAGRLPEPRAYAATVTVPGGLLVVGGENAGGVRQDAYILRWEGQRIVVVPVPGLPVPLSSPVAAVLDGKVYLAGGYQPGPPRVATDSFFSLDLGNSAAGWQPLPAWPGPPRGQAIMAALDGAIYLNSGLELNLGPDGKPHTTYLTDAYRYRPGQQWERLPDLPWSAIASPSPAPVTVNPGRVFVFGGVDGRQVGVLPRETLVPEDILYFDVGRHEWHLWPEGWNAPAVNTPVVAAQGEWIFLTGETMAGKRTTAVQAWRPRR